MNLNAYLTSQQALIEKKLEELIPELPVPQHSLFKAARYSLLGAGKRLRPILTLATVEALQGCTTAALLPACVLEIVHTYSLIHDDLPCMDNDDFRRGKPTLHKIYPEGHAVLTGDYLLTVAFELLAEAEGLSSEKKIALIALLSKSIGGSGMIGGQVLDLESEGLTVNLERLQEIHHKKTGALLTAAIDFGAILANASTGVRAALKSFGQKIGLAFQIVDDILDVTAGEKKHGKHSSDIANAKSTYVSLLGLERSQTLAKELLEAAKEEIKPLHYNVDRLIELAHFFVQRQI